MPTKRLSDDIDHVPTDPKPTKKAKKAPPRPGPIPDFRPLEINNQLLHGQSNLPDHIDCVK